MGAGLDRVRSEVGELKTVNASAKALLSSLAEKIRATAGDESAANALADELDTETNDLASAVTENTPAEGSPV